MNPIDLASAPTAPPTAAGAVQFPDLLIYRGYSAPVRIEADVYDLEVQGTIPAGLNGAYFRASADPCYPPLLGKDIFINGDGMLHQVRFDNGHADLKTRYVRTPKFARQSSRPNAKPAARCMAPTATPTPTCPR